MRFQEVARLNDLLKIYPGWNDLYRRCSSATPFQSPDWLIPLLSNLAHGLLSVIAVWAGEELVAILPLAQEDGVLSFIGAGITDYQDVLIAERYVDQTLESFSTYLREHRYELNEVRYNSPLLRLSGDWSVCNTSPVLLLPTTIIEYDRGLSAHFRESLDHSWNRLEKRGDIQIESSSSVDVIECLGDLMKLHRPRWHLKALPGVLASPEIQAFHRESVVKLVATQHARLYRLTVGGDVAAVLYLLLDKRAAYYYLGGFSPEYSGFSPGSLLIRPAIRESIRSGQQEFHFLRGGEAYKYRWGAKDRYLYRLKM